MQTSLKHLQAASDAALVRMFRRGSNRAFDVLFKRYKTFVKQYAHTLLRNTHDEKDVTQLVWEHVVEHVLEQNYLEQGRFEQWLRTLVFRKARSFYAKQKPVAWAEIPDAPAMDEPYDEKYERHKALLTMGINQLNARMRTLVEELVFKEMSYKEIAALHSISQATARKDYYRALKKLKKFLNNKK